MRFGRIGVRIRTSCLVSRSSRITTRSLNGRRVKILPRGCGYRNPYYYCSFRPWTRFDDEFHGFRLARCNVNLFSEFNLAKPPESEFNTNYWFNAKKSKKNKYLHTEYDFFLRIGTRPVTLNRKVILRRTKVGIHPMPKLSSALWLKIGFHSVFCFRTFFFFLFCAIIESIYIIFYLNVTQWFVVCIILCGFSSTVCTLFLLFISCDGHIVKIFRKKTNIMLD